MATGEAFNKPSVVVIKRSQWVRGNKLGLSKLLQVKGQSCDGTLRMCCLGFWCKAAGLTDEDIRGHGSPGDTDKLLEGLTYMSGQYESVFDTDFTDDMIDINDDSEIGEATREQKLTELANSIGVELVFED